MSMFKKMNTPLPQTLPKECTKAAKIFNSFVDRGNNGLDGVVPRTILERAKGFAIFSVVKAGFVFSARAGSGIVIARLEDGTWSAPSAIGTAGLGFGGQAGAEVTDFLIVLNSRSALRSFMSAGSLTLGGNLSIAVGPLGRNGEAIGSLNASGKLAAMYSYSKTRGLFGGVSLEGSVIVERQDANSTAYNSNNVSVKTLLSGAVPPPEWAQGLISTLEQCTGLPGGRKWIDDAPQSPGFGVDGEYGGQSGGSGARTPTAEYAFGGVASPGSVTQRSSPGLLSRRKKAASVAFPPATWGNPKSDGAYFGDQVDEFGTGTRGTSEPAHSRANSRDLAKTMGDLSLAGQSDKVSNPAPASFETHFDSDFISDDKARQHPNLTSSSTFSHPSSTASASAPHPSIAAVGRTISGYSVPQGRSGNLVDLDDHAQASPPDFNPFASGSSLTGASHTPSNSDFNVGPGHASSPFGASPYVDTGRSSVGYTGSSYSNTTLGSYAQPESRTSLDDDLYGRPGSGAGRGSNMNGRGSASPGPHLSLKPELTQPLPSYAVGRAIALYDFAAAQDGDLSFRTGQVITILEKSGNTDTWWKGIVEGRTGIFPANFVELA